MRLHRRTKYDAVIVGSGPNGLAAAIELARAGLDTLIIEGADTAGGGMRSAALTLPGFVHDVCSAVHPMALASPFFRRLDLARYGLEWVQSPSPCAHVLSGDEVVLLERSVAKTARQFGRDGDAYRALLEPFVETFESLSRMTLGPLRWPESPGLLARFGLRALRSLRGLTRARFDTPAPGALLAGIAAHAMVPLHQLTTSAFGLVLAIAGHAVGWPIARGGSQSIADALLHCYRALGGELRLNEWIREYEQLPAARAYLFDVAPRHLATIVGPQLSASYARRLRRFRYGPGVYKIDWALSAPIPWRDARCARAVTVHLSGDVDRINDSERQTHAGQLSPQPYMLLVQPTLVDDSRAPAGKHTAWAYCHVPHGSTVDAREAMERHVERFAPGFRDLILARATRSAPEVERYDPNYVGGDINVGLSCSRQLFTRPMARLDPYATSAPDIFLCSSGTPPGGGVHGMCGYWAARSAVQYLRTSC